ncbi:MAG: DUF4281 domain-containing protein [Acidobacteriaceae bacterium]|nr:DUF4281 domain-containing protein [Acidobacteriaceae bacterium]
MSHPWLLLAGWVHYLAFDLLVGSWELQDATKYGDRSLDGRSMPPPDFALWPSRVAVIQESAIPAWQTLKLTFSRGARHGSVHRLGNIHSLIESHRSFRCGPVQHLGLVSTRWACSHVRVNSIGTLGKTERGPHRYGSTSLSTS